MAKEQWQLDEPTALQYFHDELYTLHIPVITWANSFLLLGSKGLAFVL